MKLDHSNFLHFAMHHYDDVNCSDIMEVQKDLQRFKYLKKLFKRYHEKGELQTQLILNHLRILYNIFVPPMACTQMLVLKLEDNLPELKPFLVLMGYWPDKIEFVGKNRLIYGSDIVLDQHIANELRTKIKNVL